MSQCLECGSIMNLQNHHVIPKSLGGITTIILCGNCHGKIHGLDFTNHGNLIRSGLKKAKKNGIKLGRKKGTTISNKDFILKHPDISLLIMDKYSIRKISSITGKGNSTVQRVKKCIEAIQNEI